MRKIIIKYSNYIIDKSDSLTYNESIEVKYVKYLIGYIFRRW